jgi:hypothetical protein
MFADLDTHLTWLRMFALRQALRTFPMSGQIAVAVQVERGLMAGVSTRFCGERMTIGAADGCDLRLIDADVAETHAIVDFRKSVFGILAEIRAQADLSIAGEGPLAKGATTSLMRLPVCIDLGGVTLRIAAPRPSFALQSRLDRALVPAVIIIFMLALAVFVPVYQATQTGTQTALVGRAPAYENTTAPSTDMQAPAQMQLAAMGLAQDVTLAASEGGSMTAAGQVPPARWQNWQQFRIWYDAQSNAPMMISTVRQAPALANLRPVTAVQLHDPATVFFASGKPAMVGDVLEEGWTLRAISAEGLLLERAGAETRILF